VWARERPHFITQGMITHEFIERASRAGPTATDPYAYLIRTTQSRRKNWSMIRTLVAIPAGVPLLRDAAATASSDGFAPAGSATARCGVGNLDIQAQLQVTV
jgi:hypothetical protein